MPKNKKPKAQSGYIMPEPQVYSTYPVQPIQGYQQPQFLPIQQPQAQPLTQQQMPYQGSYTVGAEPENNTGGLTQQKAMNISKGIGSAAESIGGIFDTIGDIQRGIITTGGALLNALIPDNKNKKARSIQYVNSQDPYGAQTYNNMFAQGGSIEIDPKNKGKFSASAKAAGMGVQEFANHVLANKDDYSALQVKRANFAKNFGGSKAANGAVVTNYDYNDPIPNITPAQQQALNQFIPYTPTSEIQPIAPPVQNYDYFKPLDTGEFAINTDRVIADRTSPSGYIGDTYSYGTNRSFGYEGLYGNRDYNPSLYMNTGYNRYFQNGGMINDTGYLQGAPTAENSMNVIPSGNITTQGMAFPIMANGTPLYPNTGNYQFLTNTVTETPMYKPGKSYDLTEAEVKQLQDMGYDIEIG